MIVNYKTKELSKLRKDEMIPTLTHYLEEYPNGKKVYEMAYPDTMLRRFNYLKRNIKSHDQAEHFNEKIEKAVKHIKSKI